jgi:GT2 family glycosyltransferase
VTGVGVSLVLWRTELTDVERCVQALAAQDMTPLALHVLVNEDRGGESARGARELLQRLAPPFPTLVRGSTINHGFAQGHNILIEGLADCGAEAFLVLNADVLLAPGALRLLMDSDVPPDALRGPVLLAARPVTFTPEGTIDSAGIRWTWDGRHLDDRQGQQIGEVRQTPYAVAGISGACLLVPRQTWKHFNDVTGELFDPDFLAYREDAELGLRGQRLGISSWVVPAATALHVRGVRGTRRTGVSPHILRLGVRNRFLIAMKHGSARPGGRFGAPLRDVLVIAGVLVKERSSMQGLVQAWRLRHVMRAKNRVLRGLHR